MASQESIETSPSVGFLVVVRASHCARALTFMPDRDRDRHMLLIPGLNVDKSPVDSTRRQKWAPQPGKSHRGEGG